MTSNYTKAAAWVGCILALVLGVMMYLGSSSSPVQSGSTAAAGTIIPTGDWGGVQIGPQSQTPLIKAMAIGTCNLQAANASGLTLAATTTGTYNCFVGNGIAIRSTDLVQVSLQNGHASLFGALDVVDAVASSTDSGVNGDIVVTLLNNFGVASSSFPLATTSVQFEINRI